MSLVQQDPPATARAARLLEFNTAAGEASLKRLECRLCELLHLAQKLTVESRARRLAHRVLDVEIAFDAKAIASDQEARKTFVGRYAALWSGWTGVTTPIGVTDCTQTWQAGSIDSGVGDFKVADQDTYDLRGAAPVFTESRLVQLKVNLVQQRRRLAHLRSQAVLAEMRRDRIVQQACALAKHIDFLRAHVKRRDLAKSRLQLAIAANCLDDFTCCM